MVTVVFERMVAEDERHKGKLGKLDQTLPEMGFHLPVLIRGFGQHVRSILTATTAFLAPRLHLFLPRFSHDLAAVVL